MEKLNAYIVMTNGAINIVTTDPNVADQAKMKSPGSVVKRFPLTSKMAGSTGLVGEALDGDFEMGADAGGSIGRDDVEFATDDQPQDDMSMDDGEEVPMDDVEGDDDTSDVICMNTELAVRVFEYIAQNQIDGEELQALADKMADLGNQSDDVLTGEHFDEITGGEDQGDEFADDEFGGEDEFADDQGADDGVVDMTGEDEGDQQIADDLEIGEDAFDGGMPDESDFDPDLEGEGELGGVPDERGFEDPEAQQMELDIEDERLIQQFISGQISRAELINRLSIGQDQVSIDNTDPYGDDEDNFESLGEDAPQGTQQPAQNPAQFDGAYMNGYNTAKRGGQAQQQNINTPQGAAYNRGYMDAKANKPSVPPSKQQNESAVDSEHPLRAMRSRKDGLWYLVDRNGVKAHGYGGEKSRKAIDDEIENLYGPSKQQTESTRRPMREGVETFGAFLAALEKKVDRTVAPTVATLFKAKKQKAAEAEKHFDVEQDPKTSAVKVTNTPTVVPKR